MERNEVFQEIAEKSNAIIRVGSSQYKVIASQIKINGVSIHEPSQIHFLDEFMAIDSVYIHYEDIDSIYVGTDTEWDDKGPICRK